MRTRLKLQITILSKFESSSHLHTTAHSNAASHAGGAADAYMTPTARPDGADASPSSPAAPPMGKLATFIDRAMSRLALVLVLAVFCIVLVDTWRQFVTGYPGYVKFRNPPEKFK